MGSGSFLQAEMIWLVELFSLLVSLLTYLVLLFLLFGLPLHFVSAWKSGKALKQAGLIGHRVRAFVSSFYNEKTQERVAAGLSDHALLWAYVLPDHKPRAKKIIVRELMRRNYTEHQVTSWSPDAKEITVPRTFHKQLTWDEYIQLAKDRVRLHSVFRPLVFALVPGFVVYGIARELLWASYVGVLISNVGLLIIDVYFGILIWSSVLHRKRDMRILLLRPFGERRMSKALRAFVPKNIGTMGHIYTLSDRNYRPSVIFRLLAWTPVPYFDVVVKCVLSPLFRDSVRIASIWSERKFRKLESFLLQQLLPSQLSFLNGEQAFNIRSSDAWWKLSIQMLMQSCEVIVVDLSKVKQGTDWELNEIRTRLLLSKCVFVISEDTAQQANSIVEHYYGPNDMPPVFVYRANGQMFDPANFQDHFASVARPHFCD
jgi:hypothetical protein